MCVSVVGGVVVCLCVCVGVGVCHTVNHSNDFIKAKHLKYSSILTSISSQTSGEMQTQKFHSSFYLFI